MLQSVKITIENVKAFGKYLACDPQYFHFFIKIKHLVLPDLLMGHFVSVLSHPVGFPRD